MLGRDSTSIGFNSFQESVHPGRFKGDKKKAMDFIIAFCSSEKVDIALVHNGYDGSLWVNDIKHTISPYGIDIPMMIRICGGNVKDFDPNYKTDKELYPNLSGSTKTKEEMEIWYLEATQESLAKKMIPAEFKAEEIIRGEIIAELVTFLNEKEKKSWAEMVYQRILTMKKLEDLSTKLISQLDKVGAEKERQKEYPAISSLADWLRPSYISQKGEYGKAYNQIYGLATAASSRPASPRQNHSMFQLPASSSAVTNTSDVKKPTMSR